MKKIAWFGVADEMLLNFIGAHGYDITVFKTLAADEMIRIHPDIVLLTVSSSENEILPTIQVIADAPGIQKVMVLLPAASPRMERLLYDAGAFSVIRFPYSPLYLLESLEAPVKNDLEQNIKGLFTKIGVPTAPKSRAYLYAAIQYACSQQEITGNLYEEIGQKFGVSSATVEKGIRDVITRIYERGDMDLLQESFGYYLPGIKPTNLQFIGNFTHIIEHLQKAG